MARANILVIEDEPDIRDLVGFNLKQAGLEVSQAADGEEGLRQVSRLRPDLVVLDLMLPGLDGREVCRQLKQGEATRHIPVLMLTALAGETDRIVGLELGADDYLVKPFSPRELVLRVQAILRRSRQGETGSGTLRRGLLFIDPARQLVELEGQALHLTSTEFRLLHLLASAPGKVHSREALLERVWGYTYEGYSRTVDTHVRRLRAKLGQAADYIETLRGSGYRFREEV